MPNPSRYYSTAAVEMRLDTNLPDTTGGAYAGQTVNISLSNIPGASGSFNLPTESDLTKVPFTLIIDPDTSKEEVVEVTAVISNNISYTIKRAVDSSSLFSHSVGAVVKHGVSARDYADSRVHESSNTNVHGISGGIAPLASPTFTGTVILPSTTSIGTVSATEIGYLDGVTSSVQTQLNSKISSGSWSAYTGTASSGTSGTLNWYTRYVQFGKTVIWTGAVVVTSVTPITGPIVLNLPVTGQSNIINTSLGSICQFYDLSAGIGYNGYVDFPSTTTVKFSAIDTSGTYSKVVSTSSSIPFTWTTGDFVSFTIIYEAA